MLPLREADGKMQAQWDKRSFAPFAAWNEVTVLRRQVVELQDRMTTLIERINCKDC